MHANPRLTARRTCVQNAPISQTLPLMPSPQTAGRSCAALAREMKTIWNESTGPIANARKPWRSTTADTAYGVVLRHLLRERAALSFSDSVGLQYEVLERAVHVEGQTRTSAS